MRDAVGCVESPTSTPLSSFVSPSLAYLSPSLTVLEETADDTCDGREDVMEDRATSDGETTNDDADPASSTTAAPTKFMEKCILFKSVGSGNATTPELWVKVSI